MVNDDIYEGTETLAVRGSNEDPGLSVRGVRISIADDEEKPTEIRLVPDMDTVAEDGGAQRLKVTATIVGDSKRAIATQIALSFDVLAMESVTRTSVRATDFSALVNTLTIPARESEGVAFVMLSPVDDSIAEGDENLELRGSTPDLKVTSALITITDNDVAAVTISQTDFTINEGGTGSYTVVLDTEPSDDVTVTINDPTDNTDVTASPESLTFTMEDWDTPQTVTVMADQDADGADERATVTHEVSGGGYGEVSIPDVLVTVTDDETVSIVLSKSSLTVEEGDTTGETYTVKLSHAPSESVTVTVSGQDNTDLMLSGLSAMNTLTFSTSNWNTAQTVTVKADQDDDTADDDVTLTHTGAGGEYTGVEAELDVTIDDDGITPGQMNPDTDLVLTPTMLDVNEGDATGVSYTVALSHAPSAQVTVTVSGQDNTDLMLTGLSATNTLTFSTTDWNTPQTVTVKADQDDDTANEKVTLTHTAAGGEYDNIEAELAVTIDDDEAVTIVLSKSSLTVAEGNATGGTYTVKLSNAPPSRRTSPETHLTPVRSTWTSRGQCATCIEG